MLLQNSLKNKINSIGGSKVQPSPFDTKDQTDRLFLVNNAAFLILT